MSIFPAPQAPRRRLVRGTSRAISFDTWAMIAASALVLAILVGTLPGISW
jgi:hypothetical protein